jgi:spore germination cell wall hydrolase CwlJ-like protein
MGIENVTPKRFSPFVDPSQYYTVPELDTSKIGIAGQEYVDFMKKGMPPTRDAKEALKYRQDFLADYLTKPRTKEEILADQQGFFGDATQQDAETQAYLALAKYGSQVAQTPGSLLQSLVTPAGDFATDLSKIAATKSAAERSAKEFAYATAEKERDKKEQQEYAGALSALGQAVDDNRAYDEYTFKVRQEAYEKGLDLAKLDNKNAIAASQQNYITATQFSLQGGERVGGINPDTGKFEFGTRVKVLDPDAPFKLFDSESPNGLKDAPDWMTKIGDAAFVKLMQEGKVDYSKAVPKDILIPDLTQPSGMRQVAGFSLGGGFFVYTDKDGNDIPAGDPKLAQPAPKGILIGTMAEMLDVDRDAVNRTFITVKSGPLQGKTLLASQVANVGPGGQDQVIVPITNLSNELELPVYETDEQTGLSSLKSGNPMVTTTGASGVKFSDLTPQAVARTHQSTIALTIALNATPDVFKAIPEAVGPLNSVKLFSTNVISPFVPDSQKAWSQWLGTKAGQTTMEFWTRQFIKANALSDRYAIREQEILQAMAEPAKFWASKEGSLAKFQELNRLMINQLAFNRAQLGDTQPLMLQRIPTGTENDPFVYSQKGHYDYLTTLAGNPKANVKNLHLEMTAKQAKAQNFPQSIWGGKADYEPVIIKLDQILQEKPEETSSLQTEDDEPPVQISKAFPQSIQKTLSNDSEKDKLIRTIVAEAGGEGPDGQLAVANVMINRLLSSEFGTDISSLIRLNKKGYGAFSAWNSPEKGGNELIDLGPNTEIYQKIARIVDRRLSGEIGDNTGGATYYWNPDYANPSWGREQLAKHSQKGLRLGKHVFGGKITS